VAIPKPKNGLVIRYDFLWGEELREGRDTGKDRPCTIVVSSKPDESGAQTIRVAPITHTPPDRDADAVELHPQTCQRLGLDDDRMWIKTDELNKFTWDEGRVPVGMTPVAKGQWAYGVLPSDTYNKMLESIIEHQRERKIEITDRDHDEDEDEDHDNGWER